MSLPLYVESPPENQFSLPVPQYAAVWQPAATALSPLPNTAPPAYPAIVPPTQQAVASMTINKAKAFVENLVKKYALENYPSYYHNSVETVYNDMDWYQRKIFNELLPERIVNIFAAMSTVFAAIATFAEDTNDIAAATQLAKVERQMAIYNDRQTVWPDYSAPIKQIAKDLLEAVVMMRKLLVNDTSVSFSDVKLLAEKCRFELFKVKNYWLSNIRKEGCAANLPRLAIMSFFNSLHLVKKAQAKPTVVSVAKAVIGPVLKLPFQILALFGPFTVCS